MKKKFIIISSAAAVAIIICIVGFLYYFNHKNGRTLNSVDQYFILKNDVSLEDGAEALQKKAFISSKSALVLYSKYYKLNKPLKAGNYIIKSRTTMKDLLLQLESGKSDFAIVTIPEGYSLFQIASTLEKNNLIKKDELLNTKYQEFDTEGIIAQKTGVTYDLEGYLFPDTYYIPYNSDRSKIIQMMYGDFLRVFTDKYRARAAELNLSVNDIITIASLIEKEAANDQERSRIAGVIYNRLKLGMPLQIDAAVIYADTKGEKVPEKIDLKKDSKYNTYLYKGLPPGPIASPGKPSNEAALYPESNDYLYYISGPNGSIFAKTYEEHKQNVKKYLGK